MGKKPRGLEKLGQGNGPVLVYQIKVTLKEITPPVWRRIQVADDIRLDQFHEILQTVMGWTDIHLHEFVVKGISYGDTSLDTGRGLANEKKVNLSGVISIAKTKFSYIYDWGTTGSMKSSWRKHSFFSQAPNTLFAWEANVPARLRIAEALRATKNY